MKLLIDTDWATFVEDLSQEKQLEFFWAIFDYGNHDCSLKCWNKIAPLLEKGKIKYYNRLNNLKQFNTEREPESVTESESKSVTESEPERESEREPESVTESESKSVTESEPERESEREYKYKIKNIQESNIGVVGGKEKTQTLIADLEKEELAKVKSTHNDIDWADVQDRWNRIATKYNLAKIAAITEKRKQQFKARLAEHKITVEQFFYFVNKAIGTSWFLQGSKSIFGDDGIPQLIELDNKWKANFDFCLQSQSFSRMRENFYGKDCPELLAEWELLEKGEGNADEIQTL